MLASELIAALAAIPGDPEIECYRLNERGAMDPTPPVVYLEQGGGLVWLTPEVEAWNKIILGEPTTARQMRFHLWYADPAESVDIHETHEQGRQVDDNGQAFWERR